MAMFIASMFLFAQNCIFGAFKYQWTKLKTTQAGLEPKNLLLTSADALTSRRPSLHSDERSLEQNNITSNIPGTRIQSLILLL